MEEEFKKVKKEDINIVKSEKSYFLDIHNKEVDIYRVFNTIEELINHLNFYEIEGKEEIIKEIEEKYNYSMAY